MAGTRTRNRVVAEITFAHIRQLAIKFGYPVREDQILAFLNHDGHAYGMWMRMMQAGEDFIMGNLPKEDGRWAIKRTYCKTRQRLLPNLSSRGRHKLWPESHIEDLKNDILSNHGRID